MGVGLWFDSLYAAPRSAAALSPFTASDIAWCGQVEAPRRATWARVGRLKAKGPWNSNDAIETAIAFSIPDGKHATAVWDVIQPEVRRLLLVGKAESIWVVVAQEGSEHRAVAGSGAAARAAEASGVACRVYSVRAEVKEAARRYAVKTGQQGAVVTPIQNRQQVRRQTGARSRDALRGRARAGDDVQKDVR